LASLTSLALACPDDWCEYDRPGQKERVVTWPDRVQIARWRQDLAQCNGAATASRALKEHVCALHGRCEPDTFDADLAKCLAERNYTVKP